MTFTSSIASRIIAGSGERLLLRPFDTVDVVAIHAIYSDPEVMRWVGTGPVHDLSETEAMLADYAAHQQAHGFSCWAVVLRAGGRLIGDAGLMTRGDEVELGYTLARQHWGQGYGTEAARLCVQGAFHRFGLPGLIAISRPENAASIAVLTKLGFTADGQVRAYGAEHLRYRLESPLRR